jgi:hypothetical protein
MSGNKVPDDFVGVVVSIGEDGQAVFSGPGDELPKGASLGAADSMPSPADQVAAISAQQGEVDPEEANDAVVAEAEAKRDADLERVAAQQEATVKPAKKATAKKTASSSS